METKKYFRSYNVRSKSTAGKNRFLEIPPPPPSCTFQHLQTGPGVDMQNCMLFCNDIGAVDIDRKMHCYFFNPIVGVRVGGLTPFHAFAATGAIKDTVVNC